MPFSSPDSLPAGTFPDSLAFPAPLDLHFSGFSDEAFAVLERMRANPHVEQYRIEKAALDAHVTRPFKRYRDDLALNWVLPNRLPFETEKNVFSRLLKNDFGAGGAHHHLWMSFYRTGSRRLYDPQLAHSLDPDGFTVGLYVGDYAQDWVRALRTRILDHPGPFFDLLGALPEEEGWQTFVYTGSGEQKARLAPAAAFSDAAPAIRRAKGFWIRRTFPRADVLAWGPLLVQHALGAVARLWPLYLYFLDADPRTA